MSAGATKSQITNGIRNACHALAKELLTLGIETTYIRGGRLVHKESDAPLNQGPGFNISYRVLRASNGETCARPMIHISGIESVDYDPFGPHVSVKTRLIAAYVKAQSAHRGAPTVYEADEARRNAALAAARRIPGTLPTTDSDTAICDGIAQGLSQSGKH